MRTLAFPCILTLILLIASGTAEAQMGDAPDTSSKIGITEHQPGTGIKIVENCYTSLTVAIFSNLRYLNQLSTNPTYTDDFGRTFPVQRRNDFLLSKLNIYFRGWIFDPKFKFNFWYWTTNANMGQGAQVVGAGDIKYEFNKHLTLAGGVQALPCVRSTLYNFPNWLCSGCPSDG